MPPMIIALVAAATVFTLTLAFGSLWLRKRATIVEIQDIELADTRKRSVSERVDEAVRTFTDEYGFNVSPSTVTFVLVAVFAALTVLFARGFGVNPVLGVVSAAMATATTVIYLTARMAETRRKKFSKQLLFALDTVAMKLRSGVSLSSAIAQTAEQVDQPLRGELEHAVAAAATMRGNLVAPLEELARKYPSASLDTLLGVVRLNAAGRGAKSADVLEEAADTLRRHFDLIEEAKAEIAQARGEFYAVAGILATITVVSLNGMDPDAKKVLLGPAGLVLFGAALGNFVLGIVRGQRLFKNLGQ